MSRPRSTYNPGAKVNDLTNKTKVRAYYELDVSELLAILKKNKRKLGADPTSWRFMDDLRREYDDSMATLRPLLARIDETDRLIDDAIYPIHAKTRRREGTRKPGRLIDLVVYRHRGLTDDEIDMVGETAGWLFFNEHELPETLKCFEPEAE